MCRFPLITIPLAATVVTIGVFLIRGDMACAMLSAAIGYVVIWIGSQMFNAFRQWRVERHPISKLGDAEFRALCDKHAEARITFRDSVLSGNCIPGTWGFVRRTFRGRKSITLEELRPYCRGKWRVKQVAVYKLMQLER